MTAFWRTPAGLHFASAGLPDEGELASFDGAPVVSGGTHRLGDVAGLLSAAIGDLWADS